MTSLSTFHNKLKSLKKDTSGNFLILTALMMFVIIGTSGVALDYSRVFNAQSKIAGAADSAVLAVGNNLLNGVTNEERNREDFEAMLFANLEGIIPVGSLQISSFTADAETGEVKADIRASMPMTLMRVVGFDEVDLDVSAGAIFEQDDVEVAMVLDNTGSMGGDKIEALRIAAEGAVNILIPGNTSNTVRVGLVPYASSVNAGRFARAVTRGNTRTRVANAGGFAPNNFNVRTRSCTTERGGRDAATDASYLDTPLGSDRRTVNAPLPSADACPELTIRPLTSRKDRLLRDIRNMGANGFTAGHIGISWSYYMLSENWNTLWPSESDAASYNSNTRKISIIMTDGIFNTFYNGTEGTDATGPHAGLSNQRALDLCAEMKAEKRGNPGITIYTVAFEAPQEAQDLLRECANEDTSQEQFYFEADNEEELQRAFREIAQSIQSLRLSR